MRGYNVLPLASTWTVIFLKMNTSRTLAWTSTAPALVVRPVPDQIIPVQAFTNQAPQTQGWHLRSTYSYYDDEEDFDDGGDYTQHNPECESEWYCPPPAPVETLTPTTSAAPAPRPAQHRSTATRTKIREIFSSEEFNQFIRGRDVGGQGDDNTKAQNHHDYIGINDDDDDNDDEALVVIKFYASWCKVCSKFGLYIEKLARAYTLGDRPAGLSDPSRPASLNTAPLDVRWAAVEYGSNTALCRAMNIKKLPTVQFYRKGVLLTSFDCPPSQFRRVQETIDFYQEQRRQRQQKCQEEADFRATLDKGRELIRDLYSQDAEKGEHRLHSAPREELANE